MEAPIPASALIHSATLVSAGIYICGRFIYQIQIMFLEVSFITTFTAFYGAVIASCQTDVKKVLAYSTISHCGYLFFLVFFGNLHILTIYLYMHGFFKAFSFMFLGFFLQSNTIYQDYRYIGNLSGKASFEYFILPSVLLNLAGLPFFLGFFSKFFVMFSYQYHWVYHANMIFINIGACCGLIYSTQLLYNLFFEKSNRSVLDPIKPFFYKNYYNTIYILYTLMLVFIYIYICWFTFFFKNCLLNISAEFNITWFNLVFIKIFYKNFLLLVPIFFKKKKKNNLITYMVVILYVFF
jgi:NADH:ubiquinone oxidoreductase subunit 5 (subunit L)/multisubunit Na+/H+ antiporter MnhA subunit